MRREGKVSGYIKGRPSKAAIRQGEQELQNLGLCDLMQLQTDYWPRVKVTNKPTNESKDLGRCGRKACCNFFPPSKALSKTKGHRNKLYKGDLTLFTDPCWALRTRRSCGPHNSIVQKKFLTGNPYLYIDPECSIGDDDILDIDYHHGHYKNDNGGGGGDDDDDGGGGTSEVVATQDSGHYANIEVGGDNYVIGRHVDEDDCSLVVVCHDDACPHVDGTLDGDLGICGGCSVAQAIQVLGHSPPLNFDDDDAYDTDLDEWYHVVASDKEPNEDVWCLC